MPDGVATFLEDLVRIPSPSGREDKAAARVADEARALGFDDVAVDAAGNILATTGTGPVRVLLAGHVDTVPGDLPVRVDDDGVLRGRGAVDAKGPLACLLHAAARHLGSAELTLTVAGLVGEETDSRGCRHLLEADRGRERIDADHVVVGEPSGWEGAAVAYRGSRELELSVEAPARHPGHPDPNAAGRLVPVLARLLDAAGPGFDDLGVHVRSLDASEDGTASKARARVNLRYADPALLDRAERALDAFDGTVRRLDDTPPVRTERTAPVVSALVAAVRARGARPRLVRKTGTCDMNLLARLTPSICAYGPGDSALDHTPDERVELAEVERSVEVLADALERLAGASEA